MALQVGSGLVEEWNLDTRNWERGKSAETSVLCRNLLLPGMGKVAGE